MRILFSEFQVSSDLSPTTNERKRTHPAQRTSAPGGLSLFFVTRTMPQVSNRRRAREELSYQESTRPSTLLETSFESLASAVSAHRD